MITHWDFSILHWIADHLQTPFLDPVMIFFTFLGEVGIVWILLGVLLLYRPRFRRAGAAILIALLLSLLLCNILLKNAVHRPRPFQLEEVTLLISPPGEFSFPSGHASSSFAAATALFCLHKKGGAATLCLAALIAFSRLYLFVHFPSDVLCGSVVGIVCGLLSSYVFSRFLLRFRFFQNEIKETG